MCTYTVYKWENPFKSIKIGVLDCKPLLQKSGAVGLKRKILNGKFTYKMNSDFVLINAYAYYYPNLKNIYGGKSVSLKNGQILPKNTTAKTVSQKPSLLKIYFSNIFSLSSFFPPIKIITDYFLLRITQSLPFISFQAASIY